MNLTPIITIVCCTTLLISCGPSAEELAAQKQQQIAREDSIKNVTEKETKRKIEAKLAIQNYLERAANTLSSLKSELIETKGNLDAANDKMASIKEFQFGRTQAEREQQIKYQSMTISSFEERINEIEAKISETEMEIDKQKRALQNFSN